MTILIMYWVLVSKEIQHHSFMKSSTFLVYEHIENSNVLNMFSLKLSTEIAIS